VTRLTYVFDCLVFIIFCIFQQSDIIYESTIRVCRQYAFETPTCCLTEFIAGVL